MNNKHNQDKPSDSTRPVALVTGGTRGIGFAIARELAQQGFNLILGYAGNKISAEKAVAELTQMETRAIALSLPLNDLPKIKSQLSDFKALLFSNFAQTELAAVVNNAGVFVQGSSANTTEGDFDTVFSANVKGTFFLTQSILPFLNNHARLVNISSTAAQIAETDFIAYSMTKSALETWTIALARDLGPQGISVNAIRPGWIETDLNRGYWLANPETPAQAAANSALKRTGLPEDLAGLAAFLCSGQSGFVTGQIITASGGYRL